MLLFLALSYSVVWHELVFCPNLGEIKKTIIFKYLYLTAIISIIAFVFACFSSSIARLTAPVCLIALGIFLGMFMGYLDVRLNISHTFDLTDKLLIHKHLCLTMLLSFIFILMSNFAISILLYYKKFKKQNDQKLIHKFAFVVFNFFVITLFYVVFMYGITFIWLALVGQLDKMKHLFNLYVLLALLITSLSISWTSVYIASSLFVFDYIIEKQVDHKYESGYGSFLVFISFMAYY
ncbi:MAG: hypothetical protein QS2022_2220 [Candidatus Phytoplasma asteris]|uniref:Guanylate kinase n=1 Tax='Chrysanthemum coronarium' phytoplasma TaxID=1520703 RepID=A0ABQ0J4J2_9MOLU|nr:hypothetical protein ['Chrysanthemum coronarium' phytoplasma]TKA88001.1 MAG: hypothetical protein PLY_2210 [Periwinkle leaf yellowing phytoplasma]WEX19498.1 MAG: hypothetical protein QS2022_2220 [Candidatus Phytoplasma asteris]GAK74128.1 guanylate kinase ['Chrysanthemum coronarium' phytoplasma]